MYLKEERKLLLHKTVHILFIYKITNHAAKIQTVTTLY
jgi:hypothetical protein